MPRPPGGARMTDNQHRSRADPLRHRGPPGEPPPDLGREPAFDRGDVHLPVVHSGDQLRRWQDAPRQRYRGLKIRSTSNSLLHTSASGSFSAVSTPIFLTRYWTFIVQHFFEIDEMCILLHRSSLRNQVFVEKDFFCSLHFPRNVGVFIKCIVFRKCSAEMFSECGKILRKFVTFCIFWQSFIQFVTLRKCCIRCKYK